MRQLLITRTKYGFAYKDRSMNSAWIDLPRNLSTKTDLENYFTQGMDQAIRRQYDKPDLQFADGSGTPQMYYSVKPDDKMTLIDVNFDTRRRLVVTDNEVWSAEDRLTFLRQHATYLPRDIDRLEDAVSYLQTHEALTSEIYRLELASKTKEAIQKTCQEHASQFKQTAVIDQT
jgi:hypothetical protein